MTDIAKQITELSVEKRQLLERYLKTAGLNLTRAGLGQSAFIGIGAYATALADDRRGAPGDDLTTSLVQAELDGERLTSAEVASFFILLVVAGNETTTNLLGWLLHTFATQPHIYQALREHPELIPAAIEEQLRVESPVQGFYRTATVDYPVVEVRARLVG